MTTIWHTIKGYIAGAVAFVACPCHLPITLPLLLSLTAGTSLGAWLAKNTPAVIAMSTIIFIGGLTLAFKWVGETITAQTASSRAAAQQIKLPSGLTNGPPYVILLASSKCASCQEAKAISQVALQFETVDILSERGRSLAAKHNVFGAPAAIINEALVLRGVSDLERVLAALGWSTQVIAAQVK